MRTTIRIDDQLLADVKQLAAKRGETLTAVIEDALRETLARRKRSSRTTAVRLTTVGGRGLNPGVDIDDSAALLEAMEHPDAAD